ncbi:MAG TPA: RT0821/Lpp0805 family surface protein [Povalibacter sp.]|nr:RT0821/Lpp0805 family surface protein [Povalibacter sp.]
MKSPALMVCCCMLVTLLLPPQSHAANLTFLRNSPVFWFNDTDRRMMNDAAMQVLNDADPRAVREWNNPRTRAAGRVESLGRFRSADGMDCRRLRLWNQARGIEGEMTFPVCRVQGGDWRLASGVELTPA